jgi:hypothetical protein
MTDQEIIADGGEIAEASGALGLILYGDTEFIGDLQTIFSSANMGQGPGAVAWLAGAFSGAGIGEVAQLWDNNGHLAVNVYGVARADAPLFRNPDLGQGTGAVTWLTGDFTGSGNDEIAQLWDNNGHLALIVYGFVGDTMQTVLDVHDLGQGPGAVDWLTGNFTGSGRTEIAQLWDNNGNLGLNVYGIVGDTVQTMYESSNVGQGSGALAWLTGDFTGSGITQIAQLWDNNGNLAVNIYGPLGTLVTFRDLGEGPGAVAWLTGDFTGSGRTEIAQLWDNNGNLGAVIYGFVGSTGSILFDSSDLGQGSGALTFLAGNFTLSGKFGGPAGTEIAQLWDHNGILSAIIHYYDGNTLVTAPFTGDLGQGTGALAWLTGDFTLSGHTQIAQPWAT